MCGSWRPFQLHVIDKTYQEALLLRKSFGLSSLRCLSKQFEVWVPPGHLLRRVVQSPISLKPQYFIDDGSTGALMFYIEGPRFMACRSGCYSTKETYFRVKFFCLEFLYHSPLVVQGILVHSADVLRTSIDHKWYTLKSQYTLNIYFGDSKLTAKEKALILGSVFLLVS
ncbi:uncharacterized protein ACN427_001353 [Glossina fuscipes fuscipes]